MAQRKQMTWTELRVGLFVLGALVILVVAIFYVTGAGFLGPKYRLYTYLPEVAGLKTGAPVELDGVEIGNVQSVGLAPHPADKAHSILLVLRVDKRYKDQIRTDSQASLVTQGLLGDRYVTISRGISGTVLPENGTVPGQEEAAVKQVVERSADLVVNLGALTSEVRDLVGDVQEGKGTLGLLLTDPSLYNHLNSTASRVDTMVASIQRGEGTAGRLIVSEDLYNKMDVAMGHFENAMAAVSNQKGTAGKLIYDPSAYDEIKDFAAKGNALMGDVREGKGTIGKLATDEALYSNLRDASANVRDAAAKMNSNQGTMGKFFTDPALYDNLTGLSGDLRLLIGDFRKDPKKYLHIKLGLF